MLMGYVYGMPHIGCHCQTCPLQRIKIRVHLHDADDIQYPELICSRMKIGFTLLLILMTGHLFAQSKYEKDFTQFWTDFKENYAYFEKQQVDWEKVKVIYQPMADTISNRNELIRLLEKVVNELHNGHVSLNVNLRSSNRIIPSGSDLFVTKLNSRYIISDLRKDFAAELCGLKPGMEVVKFNGRSIDEQVKSFLPRFTNQYTADMQAYALAMLFAGTHNKPRSITILEKGVEKVFYPDQVPHSKKEEKLAEGRILDGNTGYIKINNSLGENELIPLFDHILDSMMNTGALILDLTETPGGGNSAVARAIMGRFIDRDLPYQKHELEETSYRIKRSWLEYVSPRKGNYRKKLIIMVGHWTGSMGEGIAIGFDGMNRGTIVGTRMAGLLGAIEGFKTAETNIGYQIPTERLYHVNGVAREDFVPARLTHTIYETRDLVNKIMKTRLANR